MALPVVLLRTANLAGQRPRLFQTDAATEAPDIRSASFIDIPDNGAMERFSIADPSGYKDYTIAAVAFLLQNSKLEHTDYLEQSSLVGDWRAVSFIDRRPLLDYLTDPKATLKLAGGAPSVALATGAGSVSAGASQKAGADAGDHRETAKRPLEDEGEDALAFMDEAIKRRKIEANDPDYLFVLGCMKRERTLNDRRKVICIQGSKNFSNVLKLGQEFFGPKAQQKTAASESQPSKATAQASHPKPGSTAKVDPRRPQHSAAPPRQYPTASKLQSRNKGPAGGEDKMPIIIVPSSRTAMLNLYNVKEFLGSSPKFVLSDELIAKGMSKPDSVIITRSSVNRPGVPENFLVVDAPERFTQEQWDRVVAVFAIGQDWQFKNWKLGGGRPDSIFRAVRGFCLKYKDDQLKDGLKIWNIHPLVIDRNRRHQDTQAVVDFWKIVDEHLSNIPRLMTA
ncbi:RNA pol II accessory factor, Cdc73 family-domain-containing protein [Cladochytrium replicatum]|nr:RNA pol II accessory factor, Cdc73 family-domain-containing protein [Cladochytrium replicatum]